MSIQPTNIDDVLLTTPRTEEGILAAFSTTFRRKVAFTEIAKRVPALAKLGPEEAEAFRLSPVADQVADLLKMLKVHDEALGVKVAAAPQAAPTAPVAPAAIPAAEVAPEPAQEAPKRRKSPSHHTNGVAVTKVADVTVEPAPLVPTQAGTDPVLVSILSSLQQLIKLAEDLKALMVTSTEHQNLVQAVNHLLKRSDEHSQASQLGQVGIAKLVSVFMGETMKADVRDVISEADQQFKKAELATLMGYLYPQEGKKPGKV